MSVMLSVLIGADCTGLTALLCSSRVTVSFKSAISSNKTGTCSTNTQQRLLVDSGTQFASNLQAAACSLGYMVIDISKDAQSDHS